MTPPVDFTPIAEFVSRNWLFTLLFGAICTLVKIVFNLHGDKATLEAKISMLQESNADLKKRFNEDITSLKAQNSQLQQKAQEHYSEDAFFAKYDFNNSGVAVHKNSKKMYCPACLQTLKREVPLPEDHEDNYWRCTVNREHIFEKVGQRPRQGYHNSDWNPVE